MYVERFRLVNCKTGPEAFKKGVGNWLGKSCGYVSRSFVGIFWSTEYINAGGGVLGTEGLKFQKYYGMNLTESSSGS